jgi:kynureninase
VAANPLAAHYSLFRVAERLLLTGHSHQAWPDVGLEAQRRAWLDAAEFVDEKWERAALQAAQVRAGFARLLGDVPGNIALGQNTHELVTRWLSGLPLRERPRIVTTDGEFYTIRRLANRLAEEALDVAIVEARPAASLAQRVASAIDRRTSCAMVSSVLFDTAEIVPDLDLVAGVCRAAGARLLVDAYHHVNVVPFDLAAMGLEDAFVTGGGYKYCQLGEGNCFLRVPPDTWMRPVLTGWFAAFESRGSDRGPLAYGGGAGAFAGATYDVTSHYRGAAVFAFHLEQGLTAVRLREINRRQVDLLQAAFDALDVAPSRARVEPIPEGRRAGFLAIRVRDASQLVKRLRERGVHADARGDLLRLGPAPYLRDDQLQDAVGILGELLATLDPVRSR